MIDIVRMSNFCSFSSVSTPRFSPLEITEAFNSTNFSSPTIVPSKMCLHVMAAPEKEENRARNRAGFRMCLVSSRSHSLALCFTHSKSFYYRTQNFSRTIANNKISWRNYRFFTSSSPSCSFLAVKSVGLGPFVKWISTSITLNVFLNTLVSFLINQFPG